VGFCRPLCLCPGRQFFNPVRSGEMETDAGDRDPEPDQRNLNVEPDTEWPHNENIFFLDLLFRLIL